MGSAQAKLAAAEAAAFIDAMGNSGSSGAAAVDLEAASTRLSPEARLLVFDVVVDSTLSSKLDRGARAAQKVALLMRHGGATLDELVADLKSMSPEGRAKAFGIFTAHPEYRLKGTRWTAAPYPDSLEVTSYQRSIDAILSVVDDAWAAAMGLASSAKAAAGVEDWSRAAQLNAECIAILQRLVEQISPAYTHDLAAAYFHQEAFLGQAGNKAAAQAAIDRSLELLDGLDIAGADEAVTFDAALAVASQATLFAEVGRISEAIDGQRAAVAHLSSLALTALTETPQFCSSKFLTLGRSAA